MCYIDWVTHNIFNSLSKCGERKKNTHTERATEKKQRIEYGWYVVFENIYTEYRKVYRCSFQAFWMSNFM